MRCLPRASVRVPPILLALGAIAFACGGAEPPARTQANVATSDWRPSSVDDPAVRPVRLDANATWRDALHAIAGDTCGGAGAVLVWGDVKVDPSAKHPVVVSIGGAPGVSGFIVCTAFVQRFLEMQVENPRIAGHGGSADVAWRGSRLVMRRRWSSGDIDLGRLDPPPEGVFQKGEALAAIVSCDDANAALGEVIAALGRVPKVFVFGMLPLD